MTAKRAEKIVQTNIPTKCISTQTNNEPPREPVNEIFDITNVTALKDTIDLSNLTLPPAPLIPLTPTMDQLLQNFNSIKDELCGEKCTEPVTDEILLLLLEKRNALIADIELLDTVVDTLHS